MIKTMLNAHLSTLYSEETRRHLDGCKKTATAAGDMLTGEVQYCAKLVHCPHGGEELNSTGVP